MRVLRFLRPVRSTATALNATGGGEAIGLDAFATEMAGPVAEAPEVNVERLVLAVIVLGALVVVQAVPTFLWVYGRFSTIEPIPTATVAAAPITPAPLPVEAASAPPCAPAPAASAQPVAAAAATVEPEKTAASRPAAAGLVAGLLAISAPVPMHVYANGRLVGTTDSESIMLPVGEHDVELVSEALGFRTRRPIAVQAGRTSSVRIDPPRVPVHINAVPWAEVWVDNQRVGETPIGNLQQTIGSHEVTFRHPELGERRMVVVVTMKEPARISMDMRKR